ncbi:hypothetical protein OS493_006343 [Desmophyllum pertusum]|uniref:Uncharacterized protein n=1 Tax=Desmophyllum pertusum TaxID=174260 RepID=A0A9X0DAH1_9CNID|nr:hypothetical protein OS493_006343 [Desmophyllum pertusum]
MASSRDVYSEDDNFLIGDDFNADRQRREARQLHLSEFTTIRREAHFARYRNSFLKCDLDQTNDRIEQERRLRSAEMERARAAVVKQAEGRRKISRHQYKPSENGATAKVHSVTNGKLVSNISMSGEAKGKDLGNDHESRFVRRNQQGFRHSVTTLSLSRASSATGKRARDLAGENAPTTAMNSLQVTSSMSTGGGKASSNGRYVGNSPVHSTSPDEQQSSQINYSENAGPVDGNNESEKRSPSVSEFQSGSERNLPAKSPSVKAFNGRASRLSRRKGSATNLQDDSDATKTHAQSQSAHEQWVWKEFDKIMKGFADFLQIEHKSVNLKSEVVVDKDTRARPPQNKTLNSLSTLSPLYFRYGTSDQVAFRF